MTSIDGWRFAAGIGLFLYGMLRLEESLRELTGRRFKLFLRRYSAHRPLAILNGTLATMVLQSSSIVLLMVIAFAGAGIISLSNALGIILGANLGTTATGWLVAIFGFSAKLDDLALPMIAIGALGTVFLSRRFLGYHLLGFVIALGLLLMGLGFMKESKSEFATRADINSITRYGTWSFFLFGFVITAAIQSSSAMITITLSALHAGIIELVPAAYIAIGADLGTTITALLASLHGTPVKKRVGMAHFLINVGTALLALAIAQPAIALITRGLSVTDPLYALVAFHSTFNALGIALFFPFLGVFERYLNRLFLNSTEMACSYIHKVSTDIPEAAIEAIRLELNLFAEKVYQFNSGLLGFKSQEESGHVLVRSLLTEADPTHEYERIKRVEGELLEYFVRLQREKLDADESAALNQYVLALRNGVQSAKATKDIRHNLSEFRESAIDIVERMIGENRKLYLPVNKRIERTLHTASSSIAIQELAGTWIDNESAHRRVNEWIYHNAQASWGEGMIGQVATFLNVNREIYNSNSLLLEALKSILLTAKEARSLP